MPFATEITQLMNNGVMLRQYAEQVRMVVAQLQELQQWAQNLKQLSPTRVLQIIRDQFGITSIEELNQMLGVSYELASTLEMLQRDVTTISYEYDLAASTIQRLNRMGYQITPGDYATAMFALSHERSEHYGERIKRFKEAHQSAQRHLMRANALISEAPQITGTVEGLAALNAGNAQMQVQLAQIAALLAAQGEVTTMDVARREVEQMQHEQMTEGAVMVMKSLLERTLPEPR
jgi:DNA-binding transcriptional regulator YdaS (Cro superfamily)